MSNFAWFVVGALAGVGGMYVAAKEKVWKPNPTDSFVVTLEDTDDDDGMVMASVSGEGALAWAKDEQSIGGSNWEGADGPDFAYAMLTNEPDLVATLEDEGYEIDDGAYTPFEEAAEFEAPDQTELADSAVIQETRRGYAAILSGKNLGIHESIDDALLVLNEQMDRDQVWLNIYSINERGNTDLLDRDGNVLASWV